MKTDNVVVRSPRPRSISSNENNRWKMKNVRSDREAVFVTKMSEKDSIEVLSFNLISGALWLS